MIRINEGPYGSPDSSGDSTNKSESNAKNLGQVMWGKLDALMEHNGYKISEIDIAYDNDDYVYHLKRIGNAFTIKDIEKGVVYSLNNTGEVTKVNVKGLDRFASQDEIREEINAILDILIDQDETDDE